MLDYYNFKEINELYLKGQHEKARHLLLEMQARYISVCDENVMLRTQVQEMEEVLFLAKNLIFDGFCYWLMTGNIRQGPFCQHCYNREGALIRLETRQDEWNCPTCGATHDRLIKPAAPTIRHAHRTSKIIPFNS